MAIPGLKRLFELAARPFRGRHAVDAEIQFHLDSLVAELVAKGWTADAALGEALHRFGDQRHHREALLRIDQRLRRSGSVGEWWDGVRTDVRYLVRSLRQGPAFVVGVTVTLALGIGVNATMIGLVDRLLFKPPADVQDPDRIVRYTLTQTSQTFGSYTNRNVTWHEFELVRDRAKIIATAAPMFSGETSLGRGESARKIRITTVTATFFPLLGVRPQLGRLFTTEEDAVGGGSPVAVIGDQLWTTEFGRRPDALGKTLVIGSARVTVIGVAPRYFTGVDLDRVDAWLPFHTGAKVLMGPSDEWRTTWDWQWLEIVGRLAPGATREQASAEATTIYRSAVATVADRQNDRGVVTYHPVIAARGVEKSMESVVAALLAGISVLLLLITCANVANLVLARGVARRREVAVRLALGVGRARLIRMFLGESVLLSVVGGGLGIGLAYLGGTAIRRWFLPTIDFSEPPLDARLAGITLLVAGVTAILVGLMPALQLSNPDLAVELKTGGADGRGSGTRAVGRTRRGLLLAQGVLSVVMLLCAGLFTRSFQRVAAVNFGLDAKRVLVAEIDLALAGYPEAQRLAFYDEARRRLDSMPGVGHASLGTANPFRNRMGTRVSLPGHDSIPHLRTGGPYYSAVSPGYFATMGVALKRGRGFTDRDRAGAEYVAVINETMATTLWPGSDPIGQCFYAGRDSLPPCRTVVGIVADPFATDLELEPTQAYYLPLGQSVGMTTDRYLFLKAAGDPVGLIGSVRRSLQTMAPNLPFATVRLLQDQIDPLFRPWRLGAGLFGAMGVLALMIVLVGLYSVLSYSVAQRAREFGIRTALGAVGRDVVTMVVAEGQRVILLGVAIGIGLALIFGRLLASLLFKTSPFDPLVYVVVAGLLVVVTAVGSLVPAWRAARIEPMSALRSD